MYQIKKSSKMLSSLTCFDVKIKFSACELFNKLCVSSILIETFSKSSLAIFDTGNPLLSIFNININEGILNVLHSLPTLSDYRHWVLICRRITLSLTFYYPKLHLVLKR